VGGAERAGLAARGYRRSGARRRRADRRWLAKGPLGALKHRRHRPPFGARPDTPRLLGSSPGRARQARRTKHHQNNKSVDGRRVPITGGPLIRPPDAPQARRRRCACSTRRKPLCYQVGRCDFPVAAARHGRREASQSEAGCALPRNRLDCGRLKGRKK
jgi:hypothetical protein